MIENDKKRHFLSLQKTDDFDLYRQCEINLAKGDRLCITRNAYDDKKKRLNNGQILEVAGVSKGKVLASNIHTGAKYILPESFGHLTHAYCVTSHASQGQTVDEVFISQPAATFSATDIKQFYVSVSRGRDAVHIYTDDKEALLERAGSSGERMGAVELISPLKNPFSQKMIQHRRQDQRIENPSPIAPSPYQPRRSHEPKPHI